MYFRTADCVLFGFILLLGFCSGDDPPNTNTKVTTTGGGTVPAGTLCYFPFKYNTVERNECVENDAGRLWCSTTYHFDAEFEYGFCDLSTFCTGTHGPATSGGTANGANCCFPFTYQSATTSECITTDDRSEGPWCGTTDEYEEGSDWGYCHVDQPDPSNTNTEITVVDGNVDDGTLCYFPFLYDGEERTECIVGGKVSSRPWCATTYDYENDGSFGYCEAESEEDMTECAGQSGQETEDGNANGARCCFPFIYENESKSECITTDDKTEGSWCATTDNYDSDGKWGYCGKTDSAASLTTAKHLSVIAFTSTIVAWVAMTL